MLFKKDVKWKYNLPTVIGVYSYSLACPELVLVQWEWMGLWLLLTAGTPTTAPFCWAVIIRCEQWSNTAKAAKQMAYEEDFVLVVSLLKFLGLCFGGRTKWNSLENSV